MRAYRLGKGCGRLSLVMLLLLAGCGGGGGGGGGLPALTYTGNTSQAAVTTLNASRLANNVFGSSDAAGIIIATSTEGGSSGPNASGGLANVARTLNHATRRALTGANRRSVSGATVTEPCESGSVTVTDTGPTTASITFNNCVEQGLTLNGMMTIQILAFQPFACGPLPEDGLPIDFIASIPRVTIRGSGVNVDGGGSLRSQIFMGPNTETVTNNLITLNNATGVMTMGQDLISVGTPNSLCNPTSISNLSFNGTIYDNLHGFVDVSTITPLQINLPQPFPTTGEIRLAGGGNPIHVRALPSTRVELRFDTNADNAGDGFAALMNWTDLTGPIGADIGDTDGDLMHNSWETFYSTVDPTDNPDGDGFNNLQEYQNGTNPNVP